MWGISTDCVALALPTMASTSCTPFEGGGGGSKARVYLQTRSTMVRLISCHPDSNKNSAGEYVRVSENWLNGELTRSTYPC